MVLLHLADSPVDSGSLLGSFILCRDLIPEFNPECG